MSESARGPLARAGGVRGGDRFGTFQATLEVVRELCSRYGRPRVLDVGCGDGRLLVALAASIRSGCGIDASEEAVHSALRRSDEAGRENLRFRAVPVERLAGSGEGPFELGLFQGSLEHIVDAEGALRAVRGVLSEGGRVVVVVISPSAPHAVASRWWLRRTDTPVVRHLGVEGVRSLGLRAGLVVEEVRRLGRGRTGTLRLPDRWSRRVLDAYDRVGGPTCAVVLARSED